jgi:hypothetical protein
MWHGCGDYTVDGEFGPFEQVTKSRIDFMVRVRFAGVARLRKDGLVCGSWLKRQISSPRFSKVEHLGRHDWIYQFVLRNEEELDDEVRGWIHEAYDVGRQTHLAR